MIEYICLGEYITAFPYKPNNRKTYIYELCNRQNELIKLGSIKYNPSFRKYCFYPIDRTVFDSRCLNDLITFMDSINKKGCKDEYKGSN